MILTSLFIFYFLKEKENTSVFTYYRQKQKSRYQIVVVSLVTWWLYSWSELQGTIEIRKIKWKKIIRYFSNAGRLAINLISGGHS